MNKIMLIGNAGRDAELTYTPTGSGVAKFSLAVSRRWTDKASGEKKEETTWFNIVAWDRLAETCSQFIRKGTKVFVEGRLNTREYTDKDGKLRTAVEVTISDMELLSTKGDSAMAGPAGGAATAVNPGEVEGQDFPF